MEWTKTRPYSWNRLTSPIHHQWISWNYINPRHCCHIFMLLDYLKVQWPNEDNSGQRSKSFSPFLRFLECAAQSISNELPYRQFECVFGLYREWLLSMFCLSQPRLVLIPWPRKNGSLGGVVLLGTSTLCRLWLRRRTTAFALRMLSEQMSNNLCIRLAQKCLTSIHTSRATRRVTMQPTWIN